MLLIDALLPEYDREMATTRRVLERVPEDRFAWKPHDKSMSLGVLATHVAQLPTWGASTMNQSEVDLKGPFVPPQLLTRADVLKAFDDNVAATRAALLGKTDAEMMAPWSLKRDGQVLFTMPKAAVMRSFVMNHVIHHRAQLSVYLRLNDVPVPSIYGPSADEAI